MTRIVLELGDITDVDVDAIVNAANRWLLRKSTIPRGDSALSGSPETAVERGNPVTQARR